MNFEGCFFKTGHVCCFHFIFVVIVFILHWSNVAWRWPRVFRHFITRLLVFFSGWFHLVGDKICAMYLTRREMFRFKLLGSHCLVFEAIEILRGNGFINLAVLVTDTIIPFVQRLFQAWTTVVLIRRVIFFLISFTNQFGYQFIVICVQNYIVISCLSLVTNASSLVNAFRITKFLTIVSFSCVWVMCFNVHMFLKTCGVTFEIILT